MQIDTSLQILALAVVTYGLLQYAKRLLPNICGRHAVLLNLLCTALTTVVTMRPKNWQEAVMVVLQASGLAAGLHGTVRSLSQSTCDDADDPPSVTVPPGTSMTLMLGLTLLPLFGCAHRVATSPVAVVLPVGAVDQTDATANQVLQTAQAFAGTLSAKAIAGEIALTKTQQNALVALNLAINTTAPVEIAYHQCGIAHPTDTAKTCGAAAVITAIASVQQTFGYAEQSLAPTVTK